MTWRRGLLLAAIALHGVLALSVVAQPLDPHQPPRTPRSLTWRLHFDSVAWPGPGADFFALYHAGVQVRRGLSPYLQEESPRTTPYYFRYLYAPVVAHTLGYALAGLAPRAAYLLWTSVIEGSLLLFLWSWRRHTADAAVRLLGTCLLLVSTPYFLELHMGQFTFVATALTVTGVLWTTRGRALAAGALLVLAGVCLKMFPIAGLPALARRGARPAFAGAFAAAVLISAGAVLFPAESAELVRLTAVDDTVLPHPGGLGLLNLGRLMLTAAGAAPAPGVWEHVAPIGLITALALASLIIVRRRMTPVSGFCALLAVFLSVFYRTAEHHFSSVLLLAIVLTGELDRATLSRDEWRAWLASLVLLALPTPFYFLPARPEAWPPAAVFALALAKIVPTAYILAVMFLHKSSPSHPPRRSSPC
jgi:hypothetical protein